VGKTTALYVMFLCAIVCQELLKSANVYGAIQKKWL